MTCAACTHLPNGGVALCADCSANFFRQADAAAQMPLPPAPLGCAGCECGPQPAGMSGSFWSGCPVHGWDENGDPLTFDPASV